MNSSRSDVRSGAASVNDVDSPGSSASEGSGRAFTIRVISFANQISSLRFISGSSHAIQLLKSHSFFPILGESPVG